MSAPHENKIELFKEITGQQNDADAQRLLAICHWDVEHAINVFFMRKSRGQQQNDEAVPLNTSDGFGNERDEVPCAKMMPSTHSVRPNGTNLANTSQRNAHPNGSMTSRNSSEIKFDHEQMLKENEINEMLEKVRQPIPPTQGILLEQNFHETYSPVRSRPHDPVFEQFAASSSAQIAEFEQSRAAHHSGLRSNARMDLGCEIVIDGISRFNPSTQSSDAGGTSKESENCGTKPQRSLKNLYKPPIELMFRGDWDQALELAKKKKQWLLINVQNALEFASAKLNRDIWSSKTVQEIIKANFVFWQVYHDSSDGARIRAYYGLDNSYPTLSENSTFEKRDRQFAEKLKFNKKRQQQQIVNGEQINGADNNSSSGCWTPAQLSRDEWTKWTVNDQTDLSQPRPDNVQLSLRLPNGQMERVLMWKSAPLSAVFSLLFAKGHHSPNKCQFVLDYPRREFVLSSQNRFSTLDEIGFGPQELIHINTNDD